VINGRFADIAEAVEAEVARRKEKIPLNIDGATAVIYGELGFPPTLTRGLFRAVALRRHPGACVGTVAGNRPQQGPCHANGYGPTLARRRGLFPRHDDE
jgi:hypothetical protein